MKTIKKEDIEKIQEMLSYSTDIIPLEELIIKSDYLSEKGHIIDSDGNVFTLARYGSHGVVAVHLYPEKANEYGIQLATGDLKFVPSIPYQAFYMAVEDDIQLIRISCGLSLNISFGQGDFSPNEKQIESLRLFMLKNNMLNSTFFLDTGEMTGNKIIQTLRSNLVI